MKTRIFAFATLLFFIASCSTSNPQLYSWGKNSRTGIKNVSSYESATYNFFKKRDNKSIIELAKTYEYLVNHPGGSRNVTPPGVCAEYGFFLLQPEIVAVLASSDDKNLKLSPEVCKEKGIALLEREITLYPEAATLLSPLINRARQ